MKKALIVEDNPTCRLVCETMIKMLGYESVFAINCEEAISKLKNEEIDLILMDIYLPCENGVDITQHIQLTITGCPPVIAITISDEMVNRYNFESLGFDEYIQKPLTIAQLKEAVNKVAA